MISYPGYAERLTLRFTSGYKATDKTVTWISSNPAIAKVGADGVVTGMAMGECVITARTPGGSATCKVTVGKAPAKLFPNKNVTVYENKNDPGANEEDMVLSDGAVVNYYNTDYKTAKNGVAKVPLGNAGDVTVSKAGYRTRTVSVTDLANNHYEVYLEKETDNPIIYDVWIDSTNVLDSEVEIALDKKDKTKISADVDWGKAQKGTIYLAQETKSVAFTGNVLETVLSDTFDVSDDIYIIAKDESGNAVKKKLQIVPKSAFMKDTKFSFGSSSNITIPDNVPFVGGKEVSIDLKTLEKLPLSVSVEKGKVKVAIGLEVAGVHNETTKKNYRKRGKTSTNKEVTNVCDDIKDIYKTFIKHPGETASSSVAEVKGAFKKLKNIDKIYKNQKAKPKGKFGFDADISVVGYMEGYIDGGQLHFLEGGIILQPEISAKWSGQFFIPIPIVNFIPFFWEAGIKGELEAMVNLARATGAAQDFTCLLSVDFKVTANGGVGVGVSGVVGLSGGVKLKLNPKLKTYMTGKPYMSLSLDGNGYVKFQFLFAEYEWESKSLKMVDINNGVPDHPNTLSAQNGAETEEMIDPTQNALDLSAYHAMDLSYLEEEGITAQSESDLGSLEELRANSFKGAAPKLVSFKDGTTLAVWIDAEDSDYDHINLYYSYYDGSVWSAPAKVYDDGTMDNAPYLVANDNTAYVVWQNARTTIPAFNKLDDTSTKQALDDISSNMGICAGVFDTATESFTATEITALNDGYIDMHPVVAANGGEAAVFWVKNLDNHTFGEGKNNCIMRSLLEDAVWSEPEVVEENVSTVMSMAAVYHNGSPVYATIRDMDGDLEDLSDTEVYIGAHPITQDNMMQSNVTTAGGRIYWYQSGTVYRSQPAAGNFANVEKLLPNEAVLQDDRYQVIDEDGKLQVLGIASLGAVNELMRYVYDPDNKSWSVAAKVTDLSQAINSFDATIADNELRAAISYSELTDPDAETISSALYGNNHVAVFTSVPHNSLDVIDCIYDSRDIVPGAVLPLTVEVKNSSVSAIDGVTLQIVDPDTNDQIGELSVEEKLLAGQETEVDYNFVLPSDCIGKNYVVRAAIPAKDYVDGQTSELNIDYKNVGLSEISWGKYSDNVTAAVQGTAYNDGYSDMHDITLSLYKVDKGATDASSDLSKAEKELVDSYTIATLGSMQSTPVLFDVPYKDEAVYNVEITSSDADENGGDNDAYVYMTVRDQKIERSLKGIEIKLLPDVIQVGTPFDTKTLKVKASFSDGLAMDVTAFSKIDASAVNTAVAGTYKISATYRGKSAEKLLIVLSEGDYQKWIQQQKGQNDPDQPGRIATVKEKVQDPTGNYQVKSVNPDAPAGGVFGNVTYQQAPGGKVKVVTIPEYIYIRGRKYAVTEIAAKAFYKNKNITKVVIPKQIVKIGSKAFYQCKNLKQIQIKTKKLKKGSIGKAAFKGAGSKNYKKLKVTVPKKKKKSYKKLLKKAGLSKKAKVK